VHVKAILRKIRAKNRTEAAIWANGLGLERLQLSAPTKLPADLVSANGDGNVHLAGSNGVQ
jgi:hypothetical protein